MGKTKIKTVDMSEPLKESADDSLQTTAKKEPAKAENVVVGSADSSSKKNKAKVKKGQPKVRGKKYQKAKAKVEPGKRYPLNEAVSLTQQSSYSKFPGSIEVHINTNSKNFRGSVLLPHNSGKKLTVLAFGKGAADAGADIVGTESTITEIEKGKTDFDAIITTPEWMPKLAGVAKVLGPKGLMPSPKNDTVTENLNKTITEIRSGKIEYKTELNGQIIHLIVGKVEQPSEQIAANVKAVYNSMGRSRIQKITLASSMGPGVTVDLGSI